MELPFNRASRLRAAALLIITACLAVAQSIISKVRVNPYLECPGCVPGYWLTVNIDGSISAAPAPVVPGAQVVFASPAAPGCISQSATGVYKFPVVPKTISVYRSGVRVYKTGEYTLNADVLTLTSPVSGVNGGPEVVLCDYTF